MIRTTIRRSHLSLKRSALVLALAASFPSAHVMAQQAYGSIFGQATPSGTVTVESVDTGTKREISADSEGRFRFSQLAPGRYKVTTDAGTREVGVNVGTGTEVKFDDGDAQKLEGMEVVAGAINPIDVSSVESTTVFNAEQVAALPVSRDISSVALLAPGTVKGDSGFANNHPAGATLASFGGSSVAENGYYINGFDVTNIRNFTTFANLPFEAIGEQQVKTGGYGAEFGRSLGGVINIVTKRGTNEWKGGVSMYWEPESLREHVHNVPSRDPEDPDGYYKFHGYDKRDSFSVNVYGSGPLVQDKLFFFGLVEGHQDTTDQFGLSSGNESRRWKNDKPHGMVKLDWNLTDNHILEFTGISNRDYFTRNVYQGQNNKLYSTSHDELVDSSLNRNGGEVYIGKYTGYLTDTFTLSAQYGQLTFLNDDRVGLEPGAKCPRVFDGRNGELEHLGCWVVDPYIIDPTSPIQQDRRRAGRIDADWQLGDHQVRFGYDIENFNSTSQGQAFSGGEYWRYFKRPANGKVNGVTLPADAQEYVRRWVRTFSSGEFEVKNTALYIEDSWQITNNLKLYGGLRSESFDNKNDAGTSFAKSGNLMAPRFGFSWDINSDATYKLFGNAGRYYIPIASNTNIRAANAEYSLQQFYTFTSIDPITGAPVGLGPQLGNDVIASDGSTPIPETVTSGNLKPMSQDEIILGLQHAFTDQWSGGVRGVWRRVKNGMDDFCYHGAFKQWALDNGYKDFDPSTVPTCVILNPGKDAEFALDLNNNGNLTSVNIPASYFNLPKYSRKYTALEFFWEKTWDEKWYLQGSYTWSRSRGNVEGYVNSILEQDDAGLTQDFDYASFLDGAYGDLSNDRRHSFKIFGMYQLAPEWRLSGNLLVQSGRPVSCYGFVPDTVPDYDSSTGVAGSGGYTSASSFYCVNENGETVLGSRGDHGRTPWINSVDLSVAWMPKFGNGDLTLKMDIFNVFNSGHVLDYNEIGDRNNQSPEHNPNYLLPATFQAPRSFRFTARYDFTL